MVCGWMALSSLLVLVVKYVGKFFRLMKAVLIFYFMLHAAFDLYFRCNGGFGILTR